MALSQDEVRHIARLTRLDLSPAEIASAQNQLGSVVEYFAKLREVPDSELAGIEPTASTELRWASDTITPFSASPAALLACSPKRIVADQIAISGIFS